MNIHSPSFNVSSLVRRAVALFSLGMFVSQVPVVVRGQDADPLPIIGYTPALTQIQGILPVTRSFAMNITAPLNLVPGVSVPVSLLVSTNGIPSGVADAVALGYVSFAGIDTGLPLTSLVFNAPNQVQSVTVQVSIPANAVPGSYGYKILGTGWPVNALLGLTNVGAFIQATVTGASAPTPPDVVISTPADGSFITVAANAFPVTVPLQFQSTSTGPNSSPITAVTASIGGVQVALTSTGLNSTTVNSSGNLVITGPGSYTVTSTATNAGGSSSDINTFTVGTTVTPPTVVINSPTVNSVYTYRVGATPTVVPFTFTATSSFGGVVTLTAKVDSANVVFSPVGLGTATATGSISLPYTTAGTHTVSVTTTDNNGTATATSNFIVNVIAPTPTIAISQPTAGATFTAPTGSTTVNVPYAFTTTSNNGFFVDSVSASLDGNPITIGGTTGLGTATATSTGTLTGVTAGSHSLVVTGISSGISVSTSTNFTVTAVQPPPTVVINTPPAGSTFTRVSGGAALSIPLTFTGTSNATNGVITQLKASLNGTALTVTSTNLGQRVANGSATLSVTSAGTYTISVTAIDAVGTASTTRTFNVAVVQPRAICGTVFFDVDTDGNYDCEDFDLSGITVRLYNSANQLVGTDTTDCGGDYSFCGLAPGTYTVVATAYAGLTPTTLNERTVTVSGCDVCAPRIGFGLNFAALRTMTAAGQNTAFWRINLDKASGCNSSGAQISSSTMSSYTCKIGSFARCSYNNISMKQASALMSSTSSNSTSQLSKELIASEYNYQRAAYIGGNKTLTFLFAYWGEYVLENPSKYGSSYTLFAKNWFAAYNNSNGGVVAGPLP